MRNLLIKAKPTIPLLRRCLWSIAQHAGPCEVTVVVEKLDPNMDTILHCFDSVFGWKVAQDFSGETFPQYVVDESVILLSNTLIELDAFPGDAVDGDFYIISPERLTLLDDWGSNLDDRFIDECRKHPLPYYPTPLLRLARDNSGYCPNVSNAACLIQQEDDIENPSVHTE